LLSNSSRPAENENYAAAGASTHFRRKQGKPVFAVAQPFRYKAAVFSADKRATAPSQRMMWRPIAWLCCGISIAVILFLSISCSTIERTVVAPPEIEGATFIGNKGCVDCHANYTRTFAASPHARIHVETAMMPVGRAGCESCHGPGSKHVAAGGGRGKFIVNPEREPQACFTCHLEVHAEFNLPQHHPVREGKMNCVQCHDPHGFDIMKPAGGLGMARLNEQCAGCHREQSRRFVFEHEALREGCTACHQAHGSINNKMLLQPDPNLCLRCHAQTQRRGRLFIGDEDHTLSVSRGTCWSSTCHTAVHGSNIDRILRY
jgi:predicted CXXCH cytochrome family protein